MVDFEDEDEDDAMAGYRPSLGQVQPKQPAVDNPLPPGGKANLPGI